MRVLFIGGTGNISSECARHLVESGHVVGVLTRGLSEIPQGCTAIRGERHDAGALRAAAHTFRPDAVINFIGYEVDDVRLDHAAFGDAIGQYVFISSTTVHSRPVRLPITEDSPIGNPHWEYARKKIECEEWLREQERFPVTIVRPSHTYSKRWVPNAIASSNHIFARRMADGKSLFVHDDGQTPWTLTAASDFALGLAGLLGREDTLGETFHITSDEVLTWNQIYTLIAEALGAPQPQVQPIPTDFICQSAPSMNGTLKGDKAHPGIFDNSKLKKFVPGFACRKSFRTGVAESADWLRADPARWKLDAGTEALIEKVLSDWQTSHKERLP
jgi:nucleoside-diphosphate-sugar epimerase